MTLQRDSGPSAGTQLGPFWLERLLGQGAHSLVLLAQGPPPLERVALKVLSSYATREPALLRRFELEGDLLGALRHPAVVALRDRGVADGRPWLALELVQGPPLEDLLRARRLSLRRGVAVLARLSRAVEYLHGAGVVHRDLSPRNVLVAAGDAPRLIDFGLAVRSASPRLTAAGALLGSPDVLAPEQVEGDPCLVTPSVDVYALGAVLYRLLTGKVPHADAPPGTRLQAVASGRVPAPRSVAADVPPALNGLCVAAMAATPADRPDVAQLCAGLEAWLAAAGQGDVRTTSHDDQAAARFPSAQPLASSSDGWVGTSVAGYRIERLLGRGGMGRVYLAMQEDVGRAVALKVVPTGRSARAARRFQQEAQALGRLRHPNLVEVHAATVEGEWGLLAMSYIEGQTLADLTAACPISPAEAARIVRDAARGLAHAHGRSVVHRDLKPANILLDREGTVHVVDFGVARVLDEVGLPGGLTQPGEFVGTLAYAAPEQLAGDAANTGPHSDVFALGVILYELLTGRRPFDGETIPQLFGSLGRGAQPPSKLRPGISPALEAVCVQALSPSPPARQSAQALAEQLDAVLQGGKARHTRARRSVGLLLVTLALAAAAFTAFSWQRPGPTADDVASEAAPSDLQPTPSAAPEPDPRLGRALQAIELGCPEDALEEVRATPPETQRELAPLLDAELLRRRPPTASGSPPPSGGERRRRLARAREELALALATSDRDAAGRALQALEVLTGADRPLAAQLPAWHAWLKGCADGSPPGERPAGDPAWLELVALPGELGFAWDPSVETAGELVELDREARAREEGGELDRALRLRAEALASHPRVSDLRFEHARALGMNRQPGEALVALALVTASSPERLGGLTTRFVRLLQQNGWASVQGSVEPMRGPAVDGARVVLWAYRVLLGPTLTSDGNGLDVGSAPPLATDSEVHELAGGVLERHPGWFALRAVRGLTRARMGFPAAADRDFAAYLLAARGETRSHVFVAACLASSGEVGGALRHLELAAASDAEEVVKWRDAWCFRSLVGRRRFDELTGGR